jgi:hypothetical protein
VKKGWEYNILSALFFLRFVAALVCPTLPLVGGDFGFATGGDLGYKTVSFGLLAIGQYSDCPPHYWIPAFAGMTGRFAGMTGRTGKLELRLRGICYGGSEEIYCG